MQDWQVKVLEEKFQLDSNINKLYSYLSSSESLLISDYDKHLLELQLQIMLSYSTVLQLRVNTWHA